MSPASFKIILMLENVIAVEEWAFFSVLDKKYLR
jgi:hypothetical protein